MNAIRPSRVPAIGAALAARHQRQVLAELPNSIRTQSITLLFRPGTWTPEERRAVAEFLLAGTGMTITEKDPA